MTDNQTAAADFLPDEADMLAVIEAESADLLAMPSANGIEGDPAFLQRFHNLPLTIETLSPEDRKLVAERMRDVPAHEYRQRQPEFVQARVIELAREARLAQGPGASANALTKARWSQANEVLELERKAQTITERLAEVIRFDPETGAPVLRHPLGSQSRRELEHDLSMAEARAARLRSGAEGSREIELARQEALEEMRARLTDAHIAKEADRLASARIVSQRIEELAEGKAKMLRPTRL